MATPEQKMQDEQDFNSAYAAEDAQAGPTQTDDDAFGLTPEVAEDDGIPESPEDATEAAPDEVVVAEAPAEQEPAPAEAVPMTAADIARETQRLKSWEGRLKARDAERKAGGPPVDSGEEAGESILEDVGESDLEQNGEMAAEKIKGMSPDEALKMLSDDFGEGFAKMLSTVIDAKVAQASSSMGQSVDEIINDIVDTKARTHFETIADKHPDFMDVADSEAFKAFVSANPGAEDTVSNGSSRDINKLLSSFKASTVQTPVPAKAEPEPASEDDMDAAEGVRSTGMRLPTQPGASKDYAAAWDEFDPK